MIDLTKLPPTPRRLTKVETVHFEGTATRWKRIIDGEEIHALVVCADAVSLTKFIAAMGNDPSSIDADKFRMVEVHGK